jgi:hypothetical protein
VVSLGKTRQTERDKQKLKSFGRHVQKLIAARGYKSAYDFWIRKAGDELSRASLNYIVSGQKEPKLLTLVTLARLLGIKLEELVRFE